MISLIIEKSICVPSKFTPIPCDSFQWGFEKFQWGQVEPLQWMISVSFRGEEDRVPTRVCLRLWGAGHLQARKRTHLKLLYDFAPPELWDIVNLGQLDLAAEWRASNTRVPLHCLLTSPSKMILFQKYHVNTFRVLDFAVSNIPQDSSNSSWISTNFFLLLLFYGFLKKFLNHCLPNSLKDIQFQGLAIDIKPAWTVCRAWVLWRCFCFFEINTSEGQILGHMFDFLKTTVLLSVSSAYIARSKWVIQFLWVPVALDSAFQHFSHSGRYCYFLGF